MYVVTMLVITIGMVMEVAETRIEITIEIITGKNSFTKPIHKLIVCFYERTNRQSRY